VADIAVLNRDPFQGSVADLKATEADLTLLEGRVVFDRLGEA
jgi:predicted amidohydrolase YtcJ